MSKYSIKPYSRCYYEMFGGEIKGVYFEFSRLLCIKWVGHLQFVEGLHGTRGNWQQIWLATPEILCSLAYQPIFSLPPPAPSFCFGFGLAIPLLHFNTGRHLVSCWQNALRKRQCSHTPYLPAEWATRCHEMFCGLGVLGYYDTWETRQLWKSSLLRIRQSMLARFCHLTPDHTTSSTKLRGNAQTPFWIECFYNSTHKSLLESYFNSFR